jgi:hypothetical protein
MGYIWIIYLVGLSNENLTVNMNAENENPKFKCKCLIHKH